MNDNIKRLNECLWLEKIGEKDDFGFEVEFVTKTAMKNHIKSRNWENAVLEHRGEFTSYLHTNYNNDYQKWNVYTYELKNGILKEIMNNVDTKLNENELDNNIRIDIQFNVLTLLMLEKYNFVFGSDFFKKMLEIYLNGHIPCGWKNNHFLVY